MKIKLYDTYFETRPYDAWEGQRYSLGIDIIIRHDTFDESMLIIRLNIFKMIFKVAFELSR